MRLFWLDYVATWRERKVWVAAGLFLYAVLAMPPLLARPPPHIASAVETWFGTADPFAMFMYVWTDLALNKLIAIVAVVLAGGVITRERDLQILPVLMAKPVNISRYFFIKALSASAVMATLYVGAHVLAAPYFSFAVRGFRAAPFFASMALHVWAAIFATALCATLAVTIQKRAASSLGSLLLLMTLIGASFAGFYNPAWRNAALFNPFALAIEAVGHLRDLQVSHVVAPMVALVLMSAVMLALGGAAARRVEV